MKLVQDAQDDMRLGYHSGAAGVLASSIAWSAAAVTVEAVSLIHAVAVLFIGGMLIHPAAILICKLLGARGSHTKGNPLASLAMANTFWMIICLPLAYGAYLFMEVWFFPAMLLIIGGRYLTFAPLYGMNVYFGLGFVLAGAGFAMGSLEVAPLVSAAVGAGIELAAAVVLFVLHSRWVNGRTAPAAA